MISMRDKIMNLDKLYGSDSKAYEAELDAIGDTLEFQDFENTQLLHYLNLLVGHAISIENSAYEEKIFNVISNALESHQLDKGIDVDGLLENLKKFDKECTSYILTLFAYSGEVRFKEIIETFLDDEKLRDDANEALHELSYRLGHV